MPFEDVGVEVLDLAAADGGDEVAEVAVARPALGLELARRSAAAPALSLPLGIELVAGDRALFEVDDVADLLAVVVVGLQAADLEDQLRVAEVDDGDLRVGRLALVVVAEPAAEADARSWAAWRRGSSSGRCPSGGRPGCRCRRCRSPRTSASCNGRGWRGTAARAPGPSQRLKSSSLGRRRCSA